MPSIKATEGKRKTFAIIIQINQHESQEEKFMKKKIFTAAAMVLAIQFFPPASLIPIISGIDRFDLELAIQIGRGGHADFRKGDNGIGQRNLFRLPPPI